MSTSSAWLLSTLESKDVETRLTIPLVCRFVAVPMDTVDKRLAAETTELKTDIEGLEKKLNYLEMTHKNSRENLEQILKSGGRA